MTDRRGLTSALIVATVCGGLHALASAIWATGSEFLLATLGDTAERFQAMEPARASLILASIAALKGAATLVPVLDSLRLMRPRAVPWRTLEAVGSSLLVLYGGISMITSAVRLITELRLETPDPDTVTAAWGHLLLWDLLFVAWGASLLVHLARTRSPVDRSGDR